MSPTQTWTPEADTRIRTRRHARHTQPNWVKRAGVAGGIFGAVALTTAAAPAQANEANEPTQNEVTQTLDLSQLRAADATAQAVVNYQLQAAQDEAQAAAAKTAGQRKAADDAARAAAAQAAKKAAEARAAAAQSASQAVQSVGTQSAPVAAASGNIGALLSFLQAQIGKAYVMGASGPSAYDCSGLVQAAFRTIGIDLPRVSESQSTAGTQVSLDALQPGDILYWGSAGSAYHVAVYVGDGNFIGAQNPSTGIVEKPLSYSEPTGAVRVA
jgi:peptidoglycan DL-endopeptidase CwlO